MKTALKQFLQNLSFFTNEEVDELAELMLVKSYKKNTVIVEQGQICNNCFFVLSGFLRQYTIIDGIEKTIAFYTEQQASNFFTSTANKTPTESFLSTIEDSIVLIGNPEKDQAIFAKFPKLADLTRVMTEQDFGRTQDAFARFMTSSPEERYLHLLKEQPELLQRVPQHQLASYLGVTPESLSRIRKRLLTKS